METGGVERALISMLKHFDYDEVEIDLYVQFLGGELYEELPKEVHTYQLETVSIKNAYKHPAFAIRKAFLLKQLKKNIPFEEQCYLSSKILLPTKTQYDIAISYHAPNTVPMFFVIDRIIAKKKILWLHGDLHDNKGEKKIVKEYHEKYDWFYAVSSNVRDGFVKLHPNKVNKINVFPNFVDEASIKNKANTGKQFIDDGFFSILTIGRLDKQKGIDLAIKACSYLVTDGYKIKWYVCGDGSERENLEILIKESGLVNSFFLLGNQNNPYGYLKSCDLYVQPSRSEGCCLSTLEARLLNKVVITTDTSAKEQFVNNETGFVVQINDYSIYQKIKSLLEHQEELKRIRTNLQCIDFLEANHIGVEDIYRE